MNKQQFNPEDDKYLAVKFHKKAVHNKFKSDEQGRQVYDDVDYISIKIPGDKTSEVCRKVREEDKDRFPVQWANYQNREESKVNGTPLDLLPGITPAEVANLKGLQVETIEQLAGLHEKAMRAFMGARELTKRAKKFLEGDNYAAKLEEKIKDLEKEIATLKEGKKDESVNDNPKRNKRNTTRRRASDDN